MYPRNIKMIHIELTDRCQASCPMCARNVNGGKPREFVGNHDISLSTFKKWFSNDFLKSLDCLYACGNYGDPIIAQDCLEIFEYIRSLNEYMGLSIHTNGSARTVDWWKNLAKVLGNNHMVTFGIDGFAESHVLYRRGTNWNKIIENAEAFISNGGKAEVDCLIFKHNEHEIDQFKQQMLDMGFVKVNLKYTKRFYDMKQFPVEDVKGKIEYYLEPSTQEKPIHFLPLEKISKDISIWEKHVKESTINPQCVSRKEVYIDARGNVFPCCWIGSDWVEQPIVENLPIQKLRNAVVWDTRSKFSQISISNLNEISIEDIFWNDLNGWINDVKPWTCVKNCNGK